MYCFNHLNCNLSSKYKTYISFPFTFQVRVCPGKICDGRKVCFTGCPSSTTSHLQTTVHWHVRGSTLWSILANDVNWGQKVSVMSNINNIYGVSNHGNEEVPSIIPPPTMLMIEVTTEIHHAWIITLIFQSHAKYSIPVKNNCIIMEKEQLDYT